MEKDKLLEIRALLNKRFFDYYKIYISTVPNREIELRNLIDVTANVLNRLCVNKEELLLKNKFIPEFKPRHVEIFVDEGEDIIIWELLNLGVCQ